MLRPARMVSWTIVFTRQAQKDARRVQQAGLRAGTEELIDILRRDPRHSPPPLEKLVGDLAGAYSRRINFKHRLVYQILDEERIVKVLRMWTHYE